MSSQTTSQIITALANGGIVSVVIAIAVWALLRITPRRALNAATRYAIWWAALAIVIALPGLYLARVTTPGTQTTPAMAGLDTVATDAGSETFEESDARRAQAAGNDFAANSSESPANSNEPRANPVDAPMWRPSIFPIEIQSKAFSKRRGVAGFLFAWVAISLAMLGRLIAAIVALQKRKARAFAPPALIAERLSHWLATCGTKRHVLLAASSEIATPMAAGMCSPSILIPAQLFSELEFAELDQIGLHETAHLARHDDYALIVQRVIEALFALHPVVRWIARRIDLEREIACDDFVLEATGHARPYATCLTKVVELAGGTRASLIAAAATQEPSHLARRVEMLLDRKRHRGTRLLKSRLAGAMIVLAGLVIAIAAAPGVFAFAVPEGASYGSFSDDPQPPIPPEPLQSRTLQIPEAPQAPRAAQAPLELQSPMPPPMNQAPAAPLAPSGPEAPVALPPPGPSRAVLAPAPPPGTRTPIVAAAPQAQSPPPITAFAPTPQAPPAPPPRYDRRYIIGEDDVLKIAVWREPDLSRTVTVRDGKIALPLIGAIPAAGLTIAEIAEDLQNAYRDRITDPRIDVEVLEVHTKPFARSALLAPKSVRGLAFAPQSQATPPAPLAPPPQADRGKTSYSVRNHEGEVDSDWIWRDGIHSRSYRMHGRIEFNDDESDVKSISPGGWFSYEESHGLTSRKYQATADTSGIKRQYLVDGRDHAFDDDARAWLRANLPELMRESAIDAPARVQRLMKKGGANAVIAEIGKIRSSGARRVYIQELVPIVNLNTEQFQTLLRDTRAISSDGDKSSLLVFLGRYTLKDSLRDYVFDAASTINSSGDRHRVLMSFIHQDPSRATLAGVAKSAEQINSDGDKAGVLVELANHYRGSEEMRRPFFRTLDTVHSSGERARVLTAVISGAAGDRDTLVDAIHSTAGVNADGDKARVLVQAVEYWKDDEATRRAFFESVSGVHSSGDHARVLMNLAGRSGLSAATWVELIHSADRIPSDGDKSRVLLSVIDRSDVSVEALIAAVQSAVRIGSEGEKARVLTAAIERSSGKPAVRTEIRNAARSIHSDGEYRRVMSALDRQTAL